MSQTYDESNNSNHQVKSQQVITQQHTLANIVRTHVENKYSQILHNQYFC